jgi:soluble lytic murein transglycosylase
MAQLRFSDPPRGVVELLATLHLLDDDVPSSHWNAGHYGDFDVAPYAGNARLWTLAYPAPRNITAIAQRVGAEVDIDPYLALAIMRHESAFRPSAQSSAGAVGLMQLMPQSARAINKQWYGKRGPAAQALRRPETNIRLGMTMLRMLAVHFRDNLPLMIAAYNAGPGVAARWYRTFKDRDTDTLVELLTYPGTVAYVKQVIGSYYAYRLVYGAGTPPPIPLELPANLGTWGDREIDAVSNRVAE